MEKDPCKHGIPKGMGCTQCISEAIVGLKKARDLEELRDQAASPQGSQVRHLEHGRRKAVKLVKALVEIKSAYVVVDVPELPENYSKEEDREAEEFVLSVISEKFPGLDVHEVGDWDPL